MVDQAPALALALAPAATAVAAAAPEIMENGMEHETLPIELASLGAHGQDIQGLAFGDMFVETR